METQNAQLSCPKCQFKQLTIQWLREAIYSDDGMISAIRHRQLDDYSYFTEAKHARCPKCNALLHIDYDLIENNK